MGGGPAGLIAAERLAEAGFAVGVYDLRRSPGRKFLLAGRGGLNLTHSEALDELLSRYGVSDRRLEAAIRSWGPDELRAWCAGLGEEPFVGTSGRVFPKSFRATPLLRAWLRRLADLGVEFHGEHRWTGWKSPGELTFSRPQLKDSSEEPFTCAADVCVLALGGASWPTVSSDGSWASVLAGFGVDVSPLVASNCGLAIDWSAVFRDRFNGTPLKNVKASIGDRSQRGDVMITSSGIEGGPIYALSGAAREALASDTIKLQLDLKPDLVLDALVARLQGRGAKESASRWLRRTGFNPAAIGVLREASNNVLPETPLKMATLAKAAPIEVIGLMPIERAISSAGGVRFDQLDDSFMLTDAPGVFVAGEMLDFDAPTGGYLLQAAFSTGVAAADGAIVWSRTNQAEG